MQSSNLEKMRADAKYNEAAALKNVTATGLESRNLERMREDAYYNQAAAIHNVVKNSQYGKVQNHDRIIKGIFYKVYFY